MQFIVQNANKSGRRRRERKREIWKEKLHLPTSHHLDLFSKLQDCSRNER